VPAINRLAVAFRAAGGTVVWTQMAAYDDGSWDVYLYRFLNAQRRAAVLRTLAPGSKGYALYPQLELDPADLVVEKKRYSPFLPGASNLERAASCSRDRHRGDYRDTHQRLLRISGARRDDA
jgi:ureidoacrylate peracid hydrolase